MRPEKKGIGAAIRHGYNAARGDRIVSIDVDSIDPRDVIRMVRKLEMGYDLVVGSRRGAGGRYEQRHVKTAVKRVLSSIGNGLISVLFGTRLTDYSLNCRVMRRKVWKSLRTEEDGNTFLIEVIIKIHFAGYRVTQIPVVFRDRIYGQSKIRFLREGIRFLYRLCVLAKDYGRFRQ